TPKFRLEPASAIAPNRQSQKRCSDDLEQKTSNKEEVLVAMEEPQVGQPELAREKVRMAIIFQNGAIEPRSMQAGVVDSPEIQVSHRPPPEHEIRRSGDEKHGSSDNNIGFKSEFPHGSAR